MRYHDLKFMQNSMERTIRLAGIRLKDNAMISVKNMKLMSPGALMGKNNKICQ